MRETTVACTKCGTRMDWLDAFPGGVCLACWAASDEAREQARTMTADKLAQMWGGKPNGRKR